MSATISIGNRATLRQPTARIRQLVMGGRYGTTTFSSLPPRSSLRPLGSWCEGTTKRARVQARGGSVSLTMQPRKMSALRSASPTDHNTVGDAYRIELEVDH